MKLYGKFINEFESLPSFPSLLNRLMDAVNDNTVSNKEIARIICLDPALVTRVLSIANSALFSSVHRINDISKAVTRLGRMEIKHLAMTIYISNLVRELNLHYIDLEEFWKHALATAFIAKKILMRHPDKSLADNHEAKEVIYIAGLLHDIGYVVNDMFFPKNFENILSSSVEANFPVFYTELNQSEYNHAAEGANLLDHWSLSDKIINGVKFHHFPEDAAPEFANIASIINLADYFANLIGFQNFVPGNLASYSETAWELQEFSDLSVEDLKTTYTEFLNQSKMFISLSKLIIS